LINRTAIQQERKRTTLIKSSEDIRNDYVQHLLANVPKDTKGKFEIIEKSTVPTPSSIINETGVYDSIEGYRIEIKKDGKSPSTMILKKKKEEEIRKEQEEKKLLAEKQKTEQEAKQELLEEDDPDTLFETMMMLRDMNMDKEDQITTSNPLETEKEQKAITPVAKPSTAPKELTVIENTPATPVFKPTPAIKQTKEESKPIEKEEKKAVTNEESKSPEDEDTNVIKVTTQKPKKAAKKKKTAVPELSLFGTIWTIVDHMTTKATRIYLSELQNNQQRVDVTALLVENDLVDDAIYLRGQILSERILDT
jgi:hypothetical protein